VKTISEQGTRTVPTTVTVRVPSTVVWPGIQRWWGSGGYRDQVEIRTPEEKYDIRGQYTEVEDYIEYETVPRMVAKEITEMVPEVHQQQTTQSKIVYRQVQRTRSVQVKVEGTRHCKKEIRFTGTRTRGWGLNAPWSETNWDPPKVTTLTTTFIPLT
jgi:hypothetical protein